MPEILSNNSQQIIKYMYSLAVVHIISKFLLLNFLYLLGCSISSNKLAGWSCFAVHIICDKDWRLCPFPAFRYLCFKPRMDKTRLGLNSDICTWVCFCFYFGMWIGEEILEIIIKDFRIYWNKFLASLINHLQWRKFRSQKRKSLSCRAP